MQRPSHWRPPRSTTTLSTWRPLLERDAVWRAWRLRPPTPVIAEQARFLGSLFHKPSASVQERGDWAFLFFVVVFFRRRVPVANLVAYW